MPKFQVYKDAKRKFRFRLKVENNEIVAVGEAYEKRASCIKGIRSIQKNCGAEIEDLTINDHKVRNPKYQIFKDVGGKFRFRLIAPNGETIAKGEGYESKEGCLNGINVVKSSCNSEIEDLSIKKRKTEKKAAPAKIEASVSSIKTKPERMSVAKAKNDVKATVPIIEAPMAPTSAETTSKPKAALPEAKMEEMSQTTPTITVETKIPKTNYPTETKLELFTVTENIIRGNSVTLRGRLTDCSSGKGVSGVEICIFERDTSILGDAFLARGPTGNDGLFNIVWKAKRLTWRKNTGKIYALFEGNEIGKPSKSCILSIIIN